MVLALAAVVVTCLAAFRGAFDSTVPVVVVADRSGLVMEPGSKVKLHGVEVGRVGDIALSGASAEIALELDPAQIGKIPANVEAEIKPTTVFGTKYVELVVSGVADPRTLPPGSRIRALSVSTEVNTVFENVTELMARIEPEKLDAILAALEDGLSGRGAELGETFSDSQQVLAALNQVLPQLRHDLGATAMAASNLGDSGDDFMTILRNATVTADTLTDREDDLAAALDSVRALGDVGGQLLGENGGALVDSFRLLTPTTELLSRYSPSYTCMLRIGAQAGEVMAKSIDVTNYSVRLDAALMGGNDPYRYPDNLPIVAGRGGPGGAPGCYPPVTWDTYPAPHLRVNHGAPLNGPGSDRPQPGNPTIVDYLFGFTAPGGA